MTDPELTDAALHDRIDLEAKRAGEWLAVSLGTTHSPERRRNARANAARHAHKVLQLWGAQHTRRLAQQGATDDPT